MTTETDVAELFDLDDGTLVRLVLEENMVPRLEEAYGRGSYVQVVLALERGPEERPSCCRNRSLKDVVGYLSNFGVPEDPDSLLGEPPLRKRETVVVYPVVRDELAVNSSPPIQILVPVVEIASYEIIQESRGPVTAPSGFP